jgi:hypothetical protein
VEEPDVADPKLFQYLIHRLLEVLGLEEAVPATIEDITNVDASALRIVQFALNRCGNAIDDLLALSGSHVVHCRGPDAAPRLSPMRMNPAHMLGVASFP